VAVGIGVYVDEGLTVAMGAAVGEQDENVTEILKIKVGTMTCFILTSFEQNNICCSYTLIVYY
jgi:hypothetical protein